MEQLNSARKNFIFEIIIHIYRIGPMIDGKLVWLQEEDPNEDTQYCSDNSGTIIYLRALQGHSGSNLIDRTLQGNVLMGTGIFPYIPRWMHIQSSFYYQQWVGTWRSKFEQKTNGVLLAC